MPVDPTESTSDKGSKPGAWQEWEIAELKRRRQAIDYLRRQGDTIFRPEHQDQAPADQESRPPAGGVE